MIEQTRFKPDVWLWIIHQILVIKCPLFLLLQVYIVRAAECQNGNASFEASDADEKPKKKRKTKDSDQTEKLEVVSATRRSLGKKGKWIWEIMRFSFIVYKLMRALRWAILWMCCMSTLNIIMYVSTSFCFLNLFCQQNFTTSNLVSASTCNRSTNNSIINQQIYNRSYFWVITWYMQNISSIFNLVQKILCLHISNKKFT